MFRTRLPLAIALAFGFAAPALADPISITSGAIYYSRSNHADFRAAGDSNLSVDLGFGDASESWTPGYACFGGYPCTPGTPLNVSINESLTSTPGGAQSVYGVFRLDGVEYGIDSMSYTIDATRDITIPDTAGERSSVESTRFIFQGLLTGTAASGASVQAELFGTGRAGVGFWNNEWHWTEYRFEDPAAVPEPGTLLLFATGGAAIVRRARARRRNPLTA